MAAVAFSLGLGGAYLATATAQFTAVVELLVDAQRADPFKQVPITIGDAQSENALVDSQVQIIASYGIGRSVVRKLHLTEDAEFMSFGHSRMGDLIGAVMSKFSDDTPLTPERLETIAVETLSRLVAVRRIGLSNVIDIEIRSPSAARSAQLANALAETYLDEQLAAKLETTRRASAWLVDGIAGVRDQAISADGAVQAFKEANHIVDTDKGLMSEQKLSDLNTELTLARNRVSEARARAERIETILTLGIGDASVSDAMQNAVIVRLRQQYLDASNRSNELAAKFGPDHSAVLKLRQEMGGYQAAAHNELERIAQSYRSDLAVALAGEESLQQEYDRQVGTSADTNKLRVALRGLQSSAETYRLLYQNFLQRYTQAVQDQTFPIPQARIFTAASSPLRKSGPKAGLILGLAGIAGLGVGFALGFLRESLDRGLRTASQVRMVLGLECVAVLPRLAKLPHETRRMRRKRLRLESGNIASTRRISTAPNSARIVQTDPFSPFSEALQAVAARIAQQHARSGDIKVIGCLSALPGEGKTTIAANLAHLLAESGRSTILLDWDLRRHALTNLLAPEAQRGFEAVLSGQAALEDVIYIDDQTKLHMLPAPPGQTPVRAGAVLGSRQTAALMQRLREQYEYIVIDLPALSPVVDAQIVSRLLDTSIVIAEWGKTDRDVINECLMRADLDPEHILGVVLNKVDTKTLRRYGPSAPAAYLPGVATRPALRAPDAVNS